MIKDKGHVRKGTMIKTMNSKGGHGEEKKSVRLKA